MAFQQFSFPQVIQDLSLTLGEKDLFGGIAPAAVRPDFLAQLLENANLAGAVNTEKARSEFVIAPVLIELRRSHGGSFGLFSGVELDADASRGLNGVCDFLLTKSPVQHVVTQPIMALVEAKNENLRTGLGQCIASMAAAQLFNQGNAGPVNIVHGAVTTGSLWKFLKLAGNEVTLDVVEYHIDNLGKIMGVLGEIVRSA